MTPPGRHALRQAVALLVTSAAVLWGVVALVPGLSVTDAGSVILATIVVAAVSALLRPALAGIATSLGWVGVAMLGLFAQALIFYAALSVAPGITLSGFWPAFWASWLYAVVISSLSWVFDANDDELFLRDAMRQAGRRNRVVDTRPGVVILQIDGLPAPLLHWAIQAGDVPTLRRWIRNGSHRLAGWTAQLPPTTPASQAGILHGRSDAVPAFRWYEKENHRLVVTSHPHDAAYVEKGMTDGRGLLADGGVSIGNIFTGDAVQSLLTISAGRGHGPSRAFAASYLRPFGFTRSVVLVLAEMVKELYQGRRQRLRQVEPRINRRSSYVALRGITNVLLRDVNVRLLVEQMLAGAPVMYCDFTDYDEVAHHAGPTRPESMASLAGIDRAIGLLERAASMAGRHYEFVVLSDHGQSQGATFRQRYGESLEAVVRRLLTPPAASVQPVSVTRTGGDEQWGPVTAFLREAGSGRGPVAGASRRTAEIHDAKTAPAAAGANADLVVTASGNLGFVYLPAHPGRLSWERLEQIHPGLVQSLADHDGVGFVVVNSEAHGTAAVGAGGVNFVDQGRLVGRDPLSAFGTRAAADVARLSRLAHVGDLIVNSRVDAEFGEVAAFEELVGCHGGLGGWQTEAVLVYPTGWSDAGELVGADAVHARLVTWLEELGQRRFGSATEVALPNAEQEIRW